MRTVTNQDLDRNSWLSPEDKDMVRSATMRSRRESIKPVILDPKTRKIGIDVDALNAQVQEKRELASREKARNDAFDNQTLIQQDLIMQNMEKERQLRYKMACDQDRYRNSRQRPDQCREYDIWRPDLLKVSRPARVGDYDPTLGVSSGQIFDGEDLQVSERLKAQARQRNEWYQTQMEEKAAYKRRDQMEDLNDQLVELETQKRLNEIAERDEYAKSSIRREIANDNVRMAQEKKQNEADQRAFEQRQNEAEIINTERTRIISEAMPQRGQCAPMDYRGMTVEDQKQIINEQANQMADNEKRRQEEARRERQWYEYSEYLKSEGDKNEAQWLRRKQQEQAALYQTQLKQEEEFKRREKYLNKVVYGQNIPDDYFYNSWGNDVR